MRKRHLILTVTAVAVIGAAAVTLLLSITRNRTDDMIYHDAVAKYGSLTVGITRTAPISIGVTEQTFDLDINTLNDRALAALQVEEVLVSVGQQVQKGTALFRVTADSVQNVRRVLQEELLETNRDCELLEARQKELRLQASQGYDSEVMDGKYAGAIYGNRCEELQKRADQAKEAVDHKQDQVNENLLELMQIQQELAEARMYLKEAEAAVSENYEERYNNAYYYTVYENTREAAKKMVLQLEEQVQDLTEKNESFLYEVDEAVRTYHQAVMDYEKEKLLVKMDHDNEIYGSETASEWYDIQMAGLDSALQDVRERYEAALQQIRRFDAYIVHDRVLSGHNGIVSDIAIQAGDILGRNEMLVTLYDQDAVTLDVSLSEGDYRAIDQQELVNISLADHPDEIYAGRITKVSNTRADGDQETLYYTVTVTIQGDVAGYYEGMSGDATFLTNEAEEVLYVPVRAIFREGERSYVKLRNKNGRAEEKSVTTGFSDGIHIEIVKGISEGDVVLVPTY